MKKIISILAAICIITSVTGVFASEYSDVDTNDVQLVEALNDLEEIGVVTGYPDGTFNPDGNITRAELAIMIYRMSRGNEYEKLESKYFPYFSVDASYPDLTEAHWAFYELAVQSNKIPVYRILEGYPDGTLRPDDLVTYTEAAQMLLKELRYYKLIEEKGGYPDGTMYWAQDLGLTDGMEFAKGDSTKAKRRDVAIMIHRAMDVPYAKMLSTFTSSTETDTGNGTSVGTTDDVVFSWQKGTVSPRQDREINGLQSDFLLTQEVIDEYNADHGISG